MPNGDGIRCALSSRFDSQKRSTFAWLALVALPIAALPLFSGPGTSDVQIWLRWMGGADRLGIIDGFIAARRDYPPLSFAILGALKEIADLVGIERAPAVKLLLAIFLAGTCLTFWLLSRQLASRLALVWTGVVGWTLLLVSVGLGYLDILYAPLLLVFVHLLLVDRPGWAAGVLFWTCVLIKWQPLILLPFVGLLFLAQFIRGQRAGLIRLLLTGAFMVGGCFAIFGEAFVSAFQRATSHQVLSGNAINFPWLLTHALHVADPETFGPLDAGLCQYVKVKDGGIRLIPRLIFGGFYLTALWRTLDPNITARRWMRLAVLGYLSYFTFNVGVHENHLFIPALLAVYGASQRIFTAIEVVAIAIGLNLNLLLFYGLTGARIDHARVIAGIDLATVAALVWVGWFVSWAWRELSSKSPRGLVG